MKVRNFAKPNITVVLQKWPICYSQTVNLTIVCSPLSAEGRGGGGESWTFYQIFKKGGLGLTQSQILEGWPFSGGL